MIVLKVHVHVQYTILYKVHVSRINTLVHAHVGEIMYMYKEWLSTTNKQKMEVVSEMHSEHPTHHCGSTIVVLADFEFWKLTLAIMVHTVTIT